MADHQIDWVALLIKAEGRKTVYNNVVADAWLNVGKAQDALSPQGEATDQLVNMGIDVTMGATGANVTRQVLGILRQAGSEHTRAIAAFQAANKHMNSATNLVQMAVDKIRAARDTIGGV